MTRKRSFGLIPHTFYIGQLRCPAAHGVPSCMRNDPLRKVTAAERQNYNIACVLCARLKPNGSPCLHIFMPKESAWCDGHAQAIRRCNILYELWRCEVSRSGPGETRSTYDTTFGAMRSCFTVVNESAGAHHELPLLRTFHYCVLMGRAHRVVAQFLSGSFPMGAISMKFRHRQKHVCYLF